MIPSIDFSQKLSQAYQNACRPLCQSLHLPQTAFDILLFLGNNPQYSTARDIVEVRMIKANLVSVNVSRLVSEGYLIRQEDVHDRRVTHLQLTEKAQSVIAQGQALQRSFFEGLLEDVSPADRTVFISVLEAMHRSLDRNLKGDSER